MNSPLVAAILAISTQGVASPAQVSPVQETNDRFVKQWMEKIAGHENDPAEKVFKNIQWLKEVPAERFLRIMNGGYSRALGVSCTHCHVESDYGNNGMRLCEAAVVAASGHKHFACDWL